MLAYQQVAYLVGIYFGMELLASHKTYFDEHSLRMQLMEQRIEQLGAEKERLEYDRHIAVNRMMSSEALPTQRAAFTDSTRPCSSSAWSEMSSEEERMAMRICVPQEATEPDMQGPHGVLGAQGAHGTPAQESEELTEVEARESRASEISESHAERQAETIARLTSQLAEARESRPDLEALECKLQMERAKTELAALEAKHATLKADCIQLEATKKVAAQSAQLEAAARRCTQLKAECTQLEAECTRLDSAARDAAAMSQVLRLEMEAAVAAASKEAVNAAEADAAAAQEATKKERERCEHRVAAATVAVAAASEQEQLATKALGEAEARVSAAEADAATAREATKEECERCERRVAAAAAAVAAASEREQLATKVLGEAEARVSAAEADAAAAREATKKERERCEHRVAAATVEAASEQEQLATKALGEAEARVSAAEADAAAAREATKEERERCELRVAAAASLLRKWKSHEPDEEAGGGGADGGDAGGGDAGGSDAGEAPVQSCVLSAPSPQEEDVAPPVFSPYPDSSDDEKHHATERTDVASEDAASMEIAQDDGNGSVDKKARLKQLECEIKAALWPGRGPGESTTPPLTGLTGATDAVVRASGGGARGGDAGCDEAGCDEAGCDEAGGVAVVATGPRPADEKKMSAEASPGDASHSDARRKKAVARARRVEQLDREILAAQTERESMGMAPLAGGDVDSIKALCTTCGNEHTLKLLLLRHPGNIRIKVVAGGSDPADVAPAAGAAKPRVVAGMKLGMGAVRKGRYKTPFSDS